MLTEQKLKEYLVAKYHPLAIILHGSRASSTNRPHSDWDVDLLVNKDTTTEQTIIDGDAVDIMALKPYIEDDKIRDKIGNAFYSAKIIFDTDNIGKDFVERVQQLATAGYRIKPEEYQSKKSFLYRLIHRLNDAGEANPIVFDCHLGNFLQRAINYSFQVNGRWSKSTYDAVDDIQGNNPELFQELNLIVSNISNTKKAESAERIYKLIFKENFE